MITPLAFGMAGKNSILLKSLNMEKSNVRIAKGMDSRTRFPDLDYGSVNNQLCDVEHVHFWVPPHM